MAKLNIPKRDSRGRAPAAIKVISIVNFAALVLTMAFWSLAFIKLPFPSSLNNIAERANMATTFGFGIADIIWSIPLLLFGGIGLWKLKPWGWLFAQMANVLWWYSLTIILYRDFFTRTVSPGAVIFLPFALFAFWAAFRLWKDRNIFFNKPVSNA